MKTNVVGVVVVVVVTLSFFPLPSNGNLDKFFNLKPATGDIWDEFLKQETTQSHKTSHPDCTDSVWDMAIVDGHKKL